ncbi:MAG: ABC transporter ATP-binding protein [Alphaproteobacteria bacterium]|jgi:putative spermidine/putrescine transport system ATP-binding protein
MTGLRLSGLTKRYGPGPAAVDGMSLEVAAGEFLALLGPSGCGKTTCLRMLAGLVPPDEGRIEVGGRDVTALPPFRRNMGLVFQNYALFPHMDVAANVAFGLEMRSVSSAERARLVAEALRLVRLEGYERRRPRELSGGQQQRVALARALVIRPDVLLLDESLSNLDAKLREQMRLEIREIQRTLAITTVFVTHDQVEALSMCDRVAVMDSGRVSQVGTPEDLYERPANRFVAGFVGRANWLAGVARAGGVDLAGTRVAALHGEADGAAVELMLRPHRLRLRRAGGGGAEGDASLPGKVRSLSYVGDVAQVEVETAAGRLVVERGTDGGDWRGFAEGEAVEVGWSPAGARAFPAGQPARAGA